MKKTLIVVDMQNDFIDGSLGTNEAQLITKNVKNKIYDYNKQGNWIIFTRDTHYSNYLNTKEGKKLPVIHCIKGTYGWKIADGLEINNCIYIDKSTFGWPYWKETFDKYDIKTEEIELIGLCTDICVVSNALILKSTFPDIEITVDINCCAGVTPKTHMAALETMKMCQINIIGR